MKKIIIPILLLMFCSLAIVSSSPPMPFPLSIQITLDGEAYYGDIYVKNSVVTPIQELQFHTNEQGYIVVEMTNYFDDPMRMVYKNDYLVVSPFSDYKFSKEIPLTEYKPTKLRLDFFTKEIGEITKYKCQDGTEVTNLDDCPVVPTKVQCWDGSLVDNENLCPPEQQPIIIKEEKIICEDGREVTDANECEEGLSPVWYALIGLAILLLGLFGWGKGFSALAKYYWNKGTNLIKEGKKKKDKVMIQKGTEYQQRAIKMIGTAIEKYKKGEYKK